MKYDATGYEQPWRENFELRAAGAWLLGALVISIGAAGMSWQLGFVLWQEWGLALTIALIMFIIRFRAARRLGKLQRTVLYGRNLTFIDFDGLREKLAQRIPVKLSLAKRFANWRAKKRGDEIPYPQFVSGGPMKTVWLGTGFAWQTRHTQRAQEIIKHDPKALEIDLASDSSAGFSDRSGDNTVMGQTWIHGLEPEEHDLWQPLSHLQGHTLILGTTGSGKTRLLDLLISQAIARKECVIIIDPKGDRELRENARRACREMGIGNRFVSFHPGFPEESVRIDPLQNWSQVSDIASRIESLLPTSSGQGDPFTKFAFQAINAIAQGLVLIYKRPSLQNLYSYLQAGSPSLLSQAMYAYAKENDPDFEQHRKARIPVPIPPRGETALLEGGFAIAETEKMAAGENCLNPEGVAGFWTNYYRQFMVQSHPDAGMEALIGMFEHNKEHASKMLASLIPIMSMLTSGEIGPLLSPRPGEGEILDMKKICDAGLVCYIGLDSLTNTSVGGAIGSILLADLTSVAGNRYNFPEKDKAKMPPINLFVDEVAEVMNRPLIQLLNKARGAGFRVTLATQTTPDLEAKLGSAAEMKKVLGNVNNVISLRLLDPDSQKFFSDGLMTTRIQYVMHTQGNSASSDNPLATSANLGERLMEEEAPLIQPQMLGSLPNLEFFAKVSGGSLLKCRVPILVDKLPDKPVAPRKMRLFDRFMEKIGA